MIATFTDRGGARVVPPAGLKFTPGRYSWRDIGGPLQATIDADGPESDLWGLSAWLRYGVEVWDHRSEAVWWGYVSAVRITAGALTISYSLDTMANRVRVVYQKRNADGTTERAVTADADDAFSQAYYGLIKENVVRGGDLGANTANALAQSTLTSYAYFAPSLEVASREAGEVSVSLECSGWWQTLAHRYATITQRDVSYTEVNSYGPYGADATYFPWGFTNGATGTGRALLYNWPTYWAGLAQEFNVSTGNGRSPMKITRVAPWLMRDGSNVPTGTVTLQIYTTTGTLPGTLIGTLTVRNAAEITDGWFDFVPVEGSDIWVLPGVTYWAVLTRSVNGTGVDNIGWNGLGPASSFSPYVTNRAKAEHNLGGYWEDENMADLTCLHLSVHAEHAESCLTFSTTSDKQKLAQSFTIAGSDTLRAGVLKLRLRKMGTIATAINLYICPDAAGVPNTASPLASVVIDPLLIGTELDWVDTDTGSSATLAPGTTYWFVLDNGALDTANFISVGASLAKGYAGGTTKVWNGSAWGAPSPDVEVLFELFTTMETSSQVAKLCTDYGALFSGVSLEVASLLYSSPARNGENTARTEAEALLEAGTSSYRRMLARVLRDKTVAITEAPAASASLYLDRAGRITNAVGLPAHPQTCPVGVWLAPRDVVPAGAPAAPLGAATLFYIEESEYDPKTRGWRPRLRGQRDPFDLGGIRL